MKKIYYDYLYPRMFWIKMFTSLLLLIANEVVRFNYGIGKKYQVVITLYLIYYIAGINRLHLNSIFEQKVRRPKVLWTKRSSLIRYALFLIKMNYGLQLAISLFLLVIQRLTGTVNDEIFWSICAALVIANFGVIFSGIQKFIFQLFSIFIFSGQIYFLFSSYQYFVLLVLCIAIQYIMVLSVFLFNAPNYDNLFSSRKNRFKDSYVSMEKLVLEYFVSNKYLTIIFLIFGFVVFHYWTNIRILSTLSPISLLPLLFFTILDPLIGTKSEENYIDRSRTKFFLSNSKITLFNKYRSSYIYIWVVYILIFNFLLFLVGLVLKRLSIISVIFVVLPYILGIIYYRKSEIVILGEGRRTRFTIALLYIIIIFGGC
jgi:hypothetical protein